MKYGLLGETLVHSFSKEIHERIADYTYDLIPLTKTEFRAYMKKKNFSAINVTIPYKKEVLPYLDELDTSAKKIGAVNTIVQNHGKLKGYNTDVFGFLYMIKKHNIQIANKKVLILGNGGASAAIQIVVEEEGANEIVIVTKRGANNSIRYDDVFHHHIDAQIIINTSPVGMYPNIYDTPLPLSMFLKCEAVLDIVYNPLLTKLCLDAKKLNIPYVHGLEMLIAQAKRAVELFLHTSIDDAIINTLYQEMLIKQSNLILIGMPSAGKTTIAQALSKHLHKEVIDLDTCIIQKTGMTIPEIFNTSKEAGFRSLETQTIHELAGVTNKIIATGGGTIVTPINMEYLSHNGVIIYIQRDLHHLLSKDPNRPLSSSEKDIKELYLKRHKLYEAYANYTISNDSTLQTVILAIVKQYPHMVSNAF